MHGALLEHQMVDRTAPAAGAGAHDAYTRSQQRDHMSPETSKLIAQAELLLTEEFGKANSRAPNCIALLDCVQDKGGAGRLSMLPSGLLFESEAGLLSVPVNELLHLSLQECSYSDAEVPVRDNISGRKTDFKNELLRMQRLQVESQDATRLLGGSANLSGGAPAAPSAKSEAATEVECDDTFKHLEKRVVVVQRLVVGGACHSAMAPMLCEMRFVALNPNDALEFCLLACSRVRAHWAQHVLADVRKACGNVKETVLMAAPVVALNRTATGFFGGKSADDLTAELALVCVCGKGVAVAAISAAVKAEHGFVIDKWRWVEYRSFTDVQLSQDDALQFSFAFAKGCAWDPVALYAVSPCLRWELCCAVQRLFHSSCSGVYLAQNLFAEKLYPASWSDVRALTQPVAELWLSRTGLPCLKFGRQGEPQVRVMRLNVQDHSLYWNSSSKKKEPLLLAQVLGLRFPCTCARTPHRTVLQVQNFNLGQRSPLFDKFQPKYASSRRRHGGVLRSAAT
jgi:hypothetical protein